MTNRIAQVRDAQENNVYRSELRSSARLQLRTKTPRIYETLYLAQTKELRKSATIEVSQQLQHWLWKNY